MKFNINWTKEDNDQMRKMISEGKSEADIREFFGNDKLFYHPTKKYYKSGKSGTLPNFKNKIKDFGGYITEIKYTELKTDFVKNVEKSKYFVDQFNYNYTFQTNSGNRYVVDFIYLNDTIGIFKYKNLYNISFTIEDQRNFSDYVDYEKITKKDENNELIKRIIYIFKDFYTNYGKNCIFLIGESEDIRKMNWYRNLIKDSFDNVIEIKDVSSFTNGLPAYYFEIINKNLLN